MINNCIMTTKDKINVHVKAQSTEKIPNNLLGIRLKWNLYEDLEKNFTFEQFV